uniref:Uncharacterized protein n=1 Tax=Anguilla anguilla TaxID=7936 RepID=A0A0E9SWL8_ANGAN
MTIIYSGNKLGYIYKDYTASKSNSFHFWNCNWLLSSYC